MATETRDWIDDLPDTAVSLLAALVITVIVSAATAIIAWLWPGGWEVWRVVGVEATIVFVLCFFAFEFFDL